MAERIPQHAHCQICGKAVPSSESFCSEECKDKYQAMVKKRRMYIYVMYGLIGLFFVLMLFQTGFIGV